MSIYRKFLRHRISPLSSNPRPHRGPEQVRTSWSVRGVGVLVCNYIFIPINTHPNIIASRWSSESFEFKQGICTLWKYDWMTGTQAHGHKPSSVHQHSFTIEWIITTSYLWVLISKASRVMDTTPYSFTPNDMSMPLVVHTYASLSLPLPALTNKWRWVLNVHVTVMPRGARAAPRLVTVRVDILVLDPGYHAAITSSRRRWHCLLSAPLFVEAFPSCRACRVCMYFGKLIIRRVQYRTVMEEWSNSTNGIYIDHRW